MNYRLEGQHALVTGAGRGIGRGCAIGLARGGASVTLVARTEHELVGVAAEIESEGGHAIPYVADVGDEAEVEEAVEAAVKHGNLRICVNSAGVNRPRSTLDLSVADWDHMMRVNLRGTFLVCRAVGAQLVRSPQGGRIINISSQMGAVGYPGRAGYCASKHGVNGLTKALAVEWARQGVTVNAVAPTFVRTPLTEPMLADPDFREDVCRRIPSGEVGEVEDVVGAVLYLASDGARLVNGHILAVDGGWVAW